MGVNPPSDIDSGRIAEAFLNLENKKTFCEGEGTQVAKAALTSRTPPGHAKRVELKGRMTRRRVSWGRVHKSGENGWFGLHLLK